MKIGALVTGPNASGKTTALIKATEGYETDRRLRVVYADNSDRASFKGTTCDMVARLTEIWLSDAEVVIIEGTRIPVVLRYVTEQHPTARNTVAFVTTTTAKVMEAQLRARCALLGKRFRDDYWSESALRYESQGRYVTNVPRFIECGAIQWFEMDETYANAPAMVAAIRGLITMALGDPQPSEFELRA